MGGDACGILEDAVGGIARFAEALQDDVGSGDLLGMEPDVPDMRGPVGQFVVFLVVPADPDFPAAVHQIAAEGAGGFFGPVPTRARSGNARGEQVFIGEAPFLQELQSVLALDPENAEAAALQEGILTAQAEAERSRTIDEAVGSLHAEIERALEADDYEQALVLARRIEQRTGQAARTNQAFLTLTMDYILNSTGILINFGIAVALGFVIGLLVAGQTLYNFTIDNLRHYGALKAMGVGHWDLAKMVLDSAQSGR